MKARRDISPSLSFIKEVVVRDDKQNANSIDTNEKVSQPIVTLLEGETGQRVDPFLDGEQAKVSHRCGHF